jgi:hypothetical protein
MRYWVAVLSAERYARERLYAFETVHLPPAAALAEGDPVALVGDGVLFGLGRVRDDLSVGYTHRFLDAPVSVSEPYPPGLTEVSAATYTHLTSGVGRSDRAAWFVSLALPIEAPSAAEAVREFWTYVDKLGPRELPAFVWPRGNELAMQAYVLGAQTNLDPEEDE